MGFDAGLYVYPMSDGTVTYEDLQTIEILLDYNNNGWAREHYSTAEEYAKSDRGERYIPQSEARIDFYRNHLTEDEFGHDHVWKDYCYWCSNGSGDIYDYISNQGTQLMPNSYGSVRMLSKKDVADFMQFCLDNVLKYAPQPCIITHAYKYQRDEEGDIPEDADITLFKVDGFEVEFIDEEDNRTTQRLDTNPDWECMYGFPKQYIDDWAYNGYLIGLRACTKILGEVDFDNSMVVYSGGW